MLHPLSSRVLRTCARGRRVLGATLISAALLIAALTASASAAPLAGAIFTTDNTCSGVNLNIFGDKGDVYLDGGPSHPGAAGLPDGYYYVQVTAPDGTLLGTSVGTANETPVHVTGGEFDSCYQLAAILHKASDAGGAPYAIDGYDDTPNPGGEYKVWVSNDSGFANDSTKTDNFKVNAGDGGPPPSATLRVRKYYDANTDGTKDPSEQVINGWRFRIHDGIDFIRETPVDITVDPDEYWVDEFNPLETNWIHTTSTTQDVTLANGDDTTLYFGNVCTGPGGGLTLGFWSNKNGQAAQFGTTVAANATLAFLNALNLRTGGGGNADFANYAAFRSWLLSATATNMSYMLSAQLAAMELNVRNGNVSGSALVYAPGASSANANGFATVAALMAEANAELGAHGLVLDGSAYRTYQEALKNALDKANNNLTFVQSNPCAFSF
jgi:hypothetical protein